MELGSGHVFFYDHETGSVKHLAQCFREFIDACKSEVIHPASRKSVQEREADMIRRGRQSVITDALRKMWQDEYDKYSAIELEEVTF